MITPKQIDEIEAARAVQALRNHNDRAFNQVMDEAFARTGGVERMIRLLATRLALEVKS